MLLSEAIREGAKLHPQHHRHGYILEVHAACGWEVLSTCALGGAWEAIDRNVDDCDVTALRENFPILRKMVSIPNRKMRGSLHEAIVNLNDAQRWSRKRIADWVATIEEATNAT